MFRIILSIKILRNLICFIRAFYLIKIRKRLRQISNQSENIWENTIDSNLRHVFDEKFLPKHPKKIPNFLGVNLRFTGRNIDLLYSIVQNNFKQDELKNKNILVVGPRNESEIFNLYGKGFSLNKIDAIDLFSYSPKITLADAHTYLKKKKYYDIIFLGWVLAYSNNKELMVKNLSKNLKDDGYLIVGYSANELSNQNALKSRGYLVSSPHNRIHNEKDLKSFFFKK